MEHTILIVDDVMLNIDILTNILNMDYKIMAAISGENALKLLERKKPDLVLLDVSMPGIDGFEVLRHMKRNRELANIPVIFVTGEHDENMEEAGLALGAVDYVKKPYNAAVVGVKVRNQLELKEYRDNLEMIVTERTCQLEERTRQLAASREAIIMGMSLMSESHDKITGDHLDRIKVFTRILTEKLLDVRPDKLTRDMANLIILYSPLHDIGKVSIPDLILKKNSGLTNEEFETMKTHTLVGAELLRKTEQYLLDKENANDLNVAIDIAECHHEKYGGNGYPHGLKGEEIPLSARIVSVADVYDALRSPRQYKRAFTHKESMDIILLGDGRTKPEDFDPVMLEVLRMQEKEFERVAFN